MTVLKTLFNFLCAIRIQPNTNNRARSFSSAQHNLLWCARACAVPTSDCAVWPIALHNTDKLKNNVLLFQISPNMLYPFDFGKLIKLKLVTWFQVECARFSREELVGLGRALCNGNTWEGGLAKPIWEQSLNISNQQSQVNGCPHLAENKQSKSLFNYFFCYS